MKIDKLNKYFEYISKFFKSNKSVALPVSGIIFLFIIYNMIVLPYISFSKSKDQKIISLKNDLDLMKNISYADAKKRDIYLEDLISENMILHDRLSGKKYSFITAVSDLFANKDDKSIAIRIDSVEINDKKELASVGLSANYEGLKKIFELLDQQKLFIGEISIKSKKEDILYPIVVNFLVL